MSALLERLALFARRHYRLVFGCSAVLVLLSILAASRLRFDTDVLNLLPPKDPVVRTFRDTLDQFGSVDMLLIAVRIPHGAPVDPYLAYVDALGPALEALPQIEYVEYRLGEADELLASFIPKSMLFLDEGARQEVERKVSDEGLRQRAAELRRLVSSPAAIAVKQLIQLDPLGVAEVLLGQMKGTRGALAVDWQSGYYLSQDRDLLLVLAKPVRPAQDVQFDAELVAAVEGAIAKVGAAWPELAGEDGGPPPAVALGGGYLIALDDAALIRRDIVLNVVSSMGCVLLLFLFAFRRPSTLLYAFVPLTVGIVVTFGLASVALGTLSSATSGVAALLIGLAIDFVIVAYGRFVEERQSGASVDAGLHTMCGSAGRGIVTGAVTTAATFFAFYVTDFRGLREMGFLAGVGILCCVVAVMVLLPAMLAWSEDRYARRAERALHRGRAVVEPRLFIHGFGADRLLRASARHPWPTMVVAIALTALLGFFALRIGFEDSIKNMRPKGNRGVLVQDEIIEHFGSGFEQMMLVVSGQSADEVIELADRASAGAEALVHQGVLAGSSSIAALIPPPQKQASALAWLRAEESDALDLGRIRATFESALREQGLRPEAFSRGLELFGRAVATDKSITLADFAGYDQTRRLVDRYVRETAAGWRSVVYLYPPPAIWKRQAPPEVTSLVAGLGPQAQLTGVNVVSERLRVKVKRDATVAGSLGALLVVILLALDFRRASGALLSTLPLLLGLVWMLGAMALLGIQLNFMNIFVITMVIGIGVDYGIHVVHRFSDHESTVDDRIEGAAETAKTVVLAALTTVVGFGSLATSHYPGLRSLGYAAALGALLTCLAAIAVLPAALALLARRRLRRSGR